MKIASYIMRLLVALNVLELGFDQFVPGYSKFVAHLGLMDIILVWIVVSSFLFPLFVVFETLWLIIKHGGKGRVVVDRRLLVDAVFGFGWFFLWWGSLIYSYKQHGIFP